MVFHRHKKALGWDKMTTSMANVVQTLQSKIIDILNSDSTTLSFTTAEGTATSSLSTMKIMDGIPVKQLREGGFPLIIVHTPEISDRRLTLRKYLSELTVHIEIIDRREGNVRILTDAVKDSLQNSESTTKGEGYWWYGRRVTSNLNYTFLSNEEGKAVWHMNLFFTYLWTGS